MEPKQGFGLKEQREMKAKTLVAAILDAGNRSACRDMRVTDLVGEAETLILACGDDPEEDVTK